MSEADSDRTTRPVELLGVLPSGARLRGYRVIAVLGQGAFGITYHARDAMLDRDVAIKEYLPTSLALRFDGTTVRPRSTELAEEFVWGRERFLDEARTLVKLEDVKAVVRVIDFLEANGTAYMVMALARGDTLDQRIKRDGLLPPAGVERLLQPLLDGLEQVHEVGFLHRDIKPANIIVDARGNPTLIDFGAARAAMAGRSTAMTAIFTPGYAAAEQFTSAKQGPWTDIYGLSATLYHAITGRTPPSAFDRILDDAYDPLLALRPQGFPAALLGGIDAGLAVRAQDRPQSIADWRDLLSGAAALVSEQRATMVLPRPKAREPEKASAAAGGRTRLALWATAAVLVAVALAGGTYIAFASRGPSIQELKAVDLERLLTERRAADTAAAEKKRLEDEAQRKAEAEAEAKRQADADLEKAREDRQKAEAELAKLKADMEGRRQAEAAGQQQLADTAARRAAEAEAQRKVEAEMAALRAAEVEAQRKATAEAENKRQADEALAKAQADRQKADQEAAARRQAEDAAAAKQKAEAEDRAKAQAEAAAAAQKQKADGEAKAKAAAEAKSEAEAAAAIQKQKAEADAAGKKAAEGIEAGLRLGLTDRQRIQVALTSLGFDTRGSDGAFGPRSREMVAAWQQKSGAPATGFVSAAQRDQLLRSAAPAVTRWEEEQKKAEEEKKKAEEEAKTKAAAMAAVPAAPPLPPPASPTPVSPAPAPPAPPAAATSLSVFDGSYTGGVMMASYVCSIDVRVTNGQGSGTAIGRACPGGLPLTISISPAGEVTGKGMVTDMNATSTPAEISGRADKGQIMLTFRTQAGWSRNATLARRDR